MTDCPDFLDQVDSLQKRSDERITGPGKEKDS